MIVTGTGHRPDKLGGYDKEVFRRLCKFAEQELVRLNVRTAIVGGALGWDMALGVAALCLKIPYVMILPFEGYDERWTDQQRVVNDMLRMGAREVGFVCKPGYERWKMQRRNQVMVDTAQSYQGKVLALWNGTDGGTANCVRYAEERRVPVENVWPSWKAFG